ncbi:hypothetical protein [Mycobacterium montefiorense]|uniref:hypothetical protein n=1 Tax=Mycobacterium montefiorense TaxID=154654 RepID=UPI0021F36608|nr:hypothetical protein [Mycobacterium montefiorense]MCV7425224.1 hypothetical protein [Mycobacterium montefiorense]
MLKTRPAPPARHPDDLGNTPTAIRADVRTNVSQLGPNSMTGYAAEPMQHS